MRNENNARPAEAGPTQPRARFFPRDPQPSYDGCYVFNRPLRGLGRARVCRLRACAQRGVQARHLHSRTLLDSARFAFPWRICPGGLGYCRAANVFPASPQGRAGFSRPRTPCATGTMHDRLKPALLSLARVSPRAIPAVLRRLLRFQSPAARLGPRSRV